MSENEIKFWCRQEYNIRQNTKIRNIDYEKGLFTIKLGDCMADLPFPKSLIRELKINKLLNGKIHR
jgi:hypothetical protein